MGKVEFRAQIKNGMLAVPQQYRQLEESIVRVTIEAEQEERRETTETNRMHTELSDRRALGQLLNLAEIKMYELDFSALEIACFQRYNALEYQRNLRDG